jgi:hypothetical protein
MGRMMNGNLIRTLAFGAIGLLSVAAAPRALAPVSGGYWQVADSAKGAPRHSVCLADPSLLAQWEHRGGRCSRVILSDTSDKTVISYSCVDGGFGRSEITQLTPRSVRVATQGISAGAPFNYVLHARRVGNCPSR